jgi:hypothetical protein
MRGHRFAETLTRLRRDQGFKTAHAFYRQRGGRQGLGLSFANYVKLERGASLPQGPRIEALASSLGLTPGSPQTRELVLAFLADTLKSTKLLEGLGSAVSDPAPPSWQLAESATRQAIGQRSLQLTPEQYAAIASDERAYACHVVLANTKGWTPKAELSELVGLAPKDVEAGLRILSKASLVELGSEGARSPLAGSYIVPPAVTPALSAVYARLLEFRKKWVERRGQNVDYKYLLLRAPRAKFSSYLPHLADVVAMSAIYGDVEPGENGSEFYLVEGRVTRLFARGREE